MTDPDRNKIKAAYADDNQERLYNPINTFVTNEGKLSHTDTDPITFERDVDQNCLRRYDALHYWFSEADGGESGGVALTQSELMGKALGERIMNDNSIELTMGRVPDWKDIRDRATIMTGLGLGDKDAFLNGFYIGHPGGVVTIREDDIHTQTFLKESDTLNLSTYSTIYMLLDLEKKAKTIIEDRLCASFTTREALAFMSADLDEIVSYEEHGKSHRTRKWLVVSQWLNDHLIQTFPCFQKNFRTLVFTDVFHRFMNGDFNINKLYRVLAMLGRINTKVVFIG